MGFSGKSGPRKSESDCPCSWKKSASDRLDLVWRIGEMASLCQAVSGELAFSLFVCLSFVEEIRLRTRADLSK